MTFLHPVSWPEVLAARAAHPEAVAVAGGTDVLVEINFHRLRPAAVLDLGRVRELGDRSRSDGVIRLGAGVTYHDSWSVEGDQLRLTIHARSGPSKSGVPRACRVAPGWQGIAAERRGACGMGQAGWSATVMASGKVLLASG